MKSLISSGRVVFAVGVAAMGVLNLIGSEPVWGLEPLPAWLPGRLFLVYLTGVILTLAGAGILANVKARLAAISLGLMFFLWVVSLHVPKLAANVRNGGAWTAAFETLALGGVAWVLAGLLTTGVDGSQRRGGVAGKMISLGRLCYAVSLPAFGILHFIYYEYVAGAVPAWIPGRLFWAYFTGVAHCAAGVSIITGVKARLAATLLGVMFGLWVLILHAPRVAADLGNRQESTSLFVALAMCGGAWVVAGSMTGEDSTVQPPRESTA